MSNNISVPQEAIDHFFKHAALEGRAIGVEEAAMMLDMLAEFGTDLSSASIKEAAISMREQAVKYRYEAEFELTEMAVYGNVPDLLRAIKR